MASCLEAKTRSIGKHPFCTLGQNLQKKLYFKTIIKTIDTFAHELELDFFFIISRLVTARYYFSAKWIFQQKGWFKK